MYDTHPWYYESKDAGTQIAGFVKEYDNIVFLTVKVSGLKRYQIFAIFNPFKSMVV